MKHPKQINARVRYLKILVFAGTMLVMSVIGLLWFLRPTTSTVEKRNLTPFPAFSWESFWDGSFLNDINTWYADTYPLREGLISANQTLQDHYGLRGNQIVGGAMTADAIPDPAAMTPAPSSKANASSTPIPEPETSPEAQPENSPGAELGEMQGSIYITDNAGYGLYYFTQDGADAYVKTMNQVYENVKDKVNLYVMITPISAGIMLDQAVLDDMGCSNGGDASIYG